MDDIPCKYVEGAIICEVSNVDLVKCNPIVLLKRCYLVMLSAWIFMACVSNLICEQRCKSKHLLMGYPDAFASGCMGK